MMNWKLVVGIFVLFILFIAGLFFVQSRWRLSGVVADCARIVENDVAGLSAVVAGDAGLCEKITSKTARTVCLASVKKSSEECAGLESGYGEFCEAVAANDISKCRDDAECRALVSGNEAECESIGLEEGVLFCKAWVRKDVEFLRSRIDGCRDEAYAVIAVHDQKERLCKKIGNDVLRENCLKAV